MKFSTLVVIDKLLSESVGDLEVKTINSRCSYEKRLSELGLTEWDDSEDLLLSNIKDHYEACIDLLTKFEGAYNDFKAVDWK